MAEAAAAAGAQEEEDPQRQRFLVELEFVQCLANPRYIDWLATQVRPSCARRGPARTRTRAGRASAGCSGHPRPAGPRSRARVKH